MKAIEVVHAWGRILQGRFPTLSIEITRECPLHCPGCYAYEDGHLGGGANLRQLSDFKGETLIEGVLALNSFYRSGATGLSTFGAPIAARGAKAAERPMD